MEQSNGGNLNHIQTFYQVARTGSFTGGARALGLPKSTVSQQIRALETRLGTRLLQRTTRRLALTEIGQVFHAHCERVMAEYDEANRVINDYQAEPRGLLRVGVPMTFARTFLGPILPGLSRKYPLMSIELVIPGGRIDLVENLLDLAIRIGGKLADSSYVVRKLGEIPQALFASERYLGQGPVITTPADLRGHELISTGRSPTGWQWRLRNQEGRLEEIHFDPRMTVPDPVLVSDLVKDGLGIAILPDFLTASDVSLVRVLPGWRPAPVEVFAVYPERRLTPLKLRVFLQELETNLKLGAL